jgi:hypothetical protein
MSYCNDNGEGMQFTIKQNDDSPSMLATMLDADDEIVPLNGATVRFHMRTLGSRELIVDEAAVVVDAPNGLVRYNWSLADTATAGSFQAEFEVTYADGGVETFPNDSYIAVTIYDDIA